MVPVTTRSATSLAGGLAIAFAGLLLYGCGDMPTAPPDEETATSAAGYGRAFGRVAYTYEGREAELGSKDYWAPDRLTLFVQATRTGQLQYMQIDGDGSFFWPLKPGDYVIVGFQASHKMDTRVRTFSGRIWATFSVEQPGQAVYVGDLRIDHDNGGTRIGFKDNHAEALEKNGARLKQGKLQAATGLLRREGRLGSYRQVTSICAYQVWGVACDRNYRGVEPRRPMATAEGIPVSENLTPLLEWKPSTMEKMTYDVVVFESLSFTYGVLDSVSNMPGARVAYAEGLREPRYALPTPLKPGKEYLWTVRVRDGDAVSTWSTTRYFAFLLVAKLRGSGQYFGFATPDR